MRKLSTGEPYALVAHVRFGGRGGRLAIPTPIGQLSSLRHFVTTYQRITSRLLLGRQQWRELATGMEAWERVKNKHEPCKGDTKDVIFLQNSTAEHVS